jgi:hypothetical protein
MSTHDLDALLDELDGKADTVTLFGQEWTLPVDVDAETMLRVQRLQMQVALAKKEGRKLGAEDVVDNNVDIDRLVETMAGAENYAAWVERGLGYRQLQAVAGRLYAIHNGEAGTSGKGTKSGRGKRTRTSTGTSRVTSQGKQE